MFCFCMLAALALGGPGPPDEAANLRRVVAAQSREIADLERRLWEAERRYYVEWMTVRDLLERGKPR